MSRSRSVLANGLAVVALGFSLLAAAPALAAPTWLAPVKLSTAGQSAEKPQVSVDARGDAVAVWRRFDGSAYLIEASSRPAGSASWQPALTISNSKEEAQQPEVALDSNGDAVAAWLSSDGIEESVQVATRTGLGGAWQVPTTLKKLGAPVLEPVGPDLAVDQRGDAVVAWRRAKLIEASSRPAGGPFQMPETVAEDAELMAGPQVGIGAAGEANVDWEGLPPPGAEIVIEGSSRPAGGKWAAAVALSQPEHVNEPRMAVDARGDAVAVWERFEEEAGTGTMEEHIEAATKPAGSAKWGKPVSLTKTETGKGEPGNQQVAIDGQGDAVVIWGRMVNTHETIEASEDRGAGSIWSTPVAVSGPDVHEGGPQVAVDEQGDALVLWERSDGANMRIEAASGLATSNAWQTPLPISAAGAEAREPQAALDAQGNGVAGWGRFDGASYRVEAAGFDAAGPLLDSLAIPGTGKPGQALAFSVSPFDVWSALGATSWSFGDGTSQAGTSVGHAYGAPGAYTVTVTSADALGNATSASAAVSITPLASAKIESPAVAPTITGARVAPSRFRVSKRPTAISASSKAPQGTSFHFTLSEPAALQIAFKRFAAGLRSGRRCVAPSSKLRRRHAKRCTRTLIVGRLSRSHEPQGADSVAFSGRIGTRALAPGVYTAVLTASAGGLTSAPVTLSLTIVR